MRPPLILGCLGLLVTLVFSVPSGAQSAPELEVKEAPIVFSSRVNLVSVPVVVRDRQGRPVGNLRQEDFQLLDKGKPQEITKFSIQRSDSLTAGGSVQDARSTSISTTQALPDRYVAYLFDDVHLKSGDLLQSREAVNRHLDESIEPNSRAAIFTTSGKMLTNFTDDREKLHAAVNSVQPWTGGPDTRDCPTMSYYVADYLVNKTQYLDGFLYTDETLVGIVGTDQIFNAVYQEAALCPQTSPSNSGIDPLIIRALRLAAHRVLEYRDQETAFALEAVKEVVRKMSVMPGSRTMVLVSPGFLMTKSGDHGSKEFDVLEQAIRANVTVNTIDMRGLYTNIPGGDASEPGYKSAMSGILLQADIAEASQKDDVLAEVAAGTGGTFFHNDNGLKEGLSRIASRPEFVYVLGYSPQNLKFDGSYHALKVTLRNSSGLSIEARRGYWVANHDVTPAEQAKEEIQDAVFSRDELQDIPVDLQTEFFKSTDTAAELTVTLRLDVKGLKLRREGDRNLDSLTVVTGLFDPNGNYVSGIQRVVNMRLRDETWQSLQHSGLIVKESFHVGPGRYLVRVVARDSEGKVMAARNGGVEIP